MRVQGEHSSTHSGQRWNFMVLMLENRNDISEESDLDLESLAGSSFSEIRLRRNMVGTNGPNHILHRKNRTEVCLSNYSQPV